MAFNDKENEIIQFGIQNGKSKDEIRGAIVKYRAASAPSGSFSTEEATTDIKEGIKEIGKAGLKGRETAISVQEDVSAGKISPFAGTLKTIGSGLRAGAEVVGQVPTTLAKLALPQKQEEAIGKATSDVAKSVAEYGPVKSLVQKYESLDPETKAVVDGALGTAEGLATLLGAGPGVKYLKEAITLAASASRVASNKVLSTARDRAGTLFTKPVKTVDDVILQAEASPSIVRSVAEAGAPEVSFREKWIGISLDIKKRIAGKQDQLAEYFDVAHARNVDDTLPTPYEYGSSRAQDAVSTMETLINESGGKIGATRQKIGTYKATPDQVSRVETGFTDQLGKLNLEVRNGIVRQIPGKITKASPGDITTLNGFYDDLKVIKQSPTLTNLIEFRSALDSRVNFAKRASEASNEIDPFSRVVRKDIADVGAEIVGKTDAGELAQFSNFMDAYNDLRSYTDRNAGGEYLLRLALSGRGGEARNIIKTIKDYTGIDLMDDATMMTIATDVIGNSRQQNLFRQEITKAGLDIAALTKGSPAGAAGLLSNLITKHALDQEKIYLKAAK